MSKTIEEVIKGLPPNDGRKPYWEEMLDNIRAMRYKVTLQNLLYHSSDCDWYQQVEIVAGEITRQSIEK